MQSKEKMQSKKKLWRIITGFISSVITAGVIFQPIPVMAATSKAVAKSDEQIKDDVTRAVLEMENIMSKSYQNAQEELSALCADGYDYELSMESFKDQGLPFSGYDYETFIAAYATIQEYCLKNDLDLGEGINRINFVQMKTSPDTITEYIPKTIPKYKQIEDGVYQQDGTTFVAEPSNIGVYTVNKDGTYSLSDTEFCDLKSRDTKYLDVTLDTVTIDQVYETFGLDRKELQDAETKRFNKLQQVLGEAKLDQLTFLNTGAARTETDNEVLANANALSVSNSQKVLIQIASTLIGRIPYEWGGKSDKAGFDDTWYTFDISSRQKGLDCSGYIQWILRTAGVDGWEELVNTGNFLHSSRLTPIVMQDLKPGDLGLFYPDSNARTNHIGMYLGNGYWIHCSSTAGTVAISNNMKFSIFRRLNLLASELGNSGLLVESELAPTQDSIIEVNPSQDTVVEAPSSPIITEYTEELGAAVSSEEAELNLMAKIVMEESYGEGYNGWVGVAQVIKNRILSDKWGNDVTSVVSEPGQFSTYRAALRMSDSDIDPAVLSVCQKVLAGELAIFDSNDVIGFKRAKAGSDNWNGWHRYTTLGNHDFYTL